VNRQESWEPYHVEFGFKPEESSVGTVFGINDSCRFTPQAIAASRRSRHWPKVIKMHHGESSRRRQLRRLARPLIALGIEDAEIMRARYHQEAGQGLLVGAICVAQVLRDSRAAGKGTRVDGELLKDAPHVTPDRVVHLSSKAEDIMVIVVAASNDTRYFLPMWTGRNTLCVIKPIR